MKILFIHQKYNQFGGLERILHEIALYYKNSLNFDVTMLVRSWVGTNESKLKTVIVGGFYIGAIWRDINFNKAVHQYLKFNDFDVIISDQKIDGIDVYIAGGGVHVSYLKQRRKHGGFCFFFSTYARLYNYFIMYAERTLFSSEKLKKIICVSELVKNDIESNYTINVPKLATVYNGIDINNFKRSFKAREDHRKSLNLGNMFTLIFVGSGFERKGLYQSILALKELPNVALLIIGKDNNTNYYEKFAKELSVLSRCRFLGPQSSVVDYYSASDAFILPSSYEPFGLVYLEALANGMPVLVSDMAGASETIKDGKHGYVVKHDDVSDIVKKIRLLMSVEISVDDCIKLASQYTIDNMIYQMNNVIFHSGIIR